MDFFHKVFYGQKKLCLFEICCFLCCMASCGKQTNTQAAQTYFRMAFSELSDDPDSIQSCRRALEHVDAALEQIKKPEYYALKATILFKLQNYVESEACFKKALALQPDDAIRADIMNNYACLLAYKGDVEGAKKQWECLSKNALYKTPEVALVNLAKVYVEEKRLSSALDVFKKVVKDAPSYIDAHFYLGLVAHELGDKQLAEQEIKLVLAMEPTHQGATLLASAAGVPMTLEKEESVFEH